MRLEDLERIANTYSQAQELAQQQDKLKTEAEARQAAKRLEREGKQDIAKTQEILKQLQAEEALTVIRDEVWNEGEISFNPGLCRSGAGRGLSLRSKPFSYLVWEDKAIWGKKQVSGLSLQQAYVALNILVTLPRSKGELFGVTLSDCGTFEVGQRKSEIIKEAVKRRGVDFQVVWDATKIMQGRTSVFTSDSGFFLMQKADTNEKFLAMIYEYQATQKELGSLPAQVREWTTDLISELPPTLRETGFIDRYQLREWAYSIKKTPAPFRVLGMAWDRFF